LDCWVWLCPVNTQCSVLPCDHVGGAEHRSLALTWPACFCWERRAFFRKEIWLLSFSLSLLCCFIFVRSFNELPLLSLGVCVCVCVCVLFSPPSPTTLRLY
jgi:hypothetical protein